MPPADSPPAPFWPSNPRAWILILPNGGIEQADSSQHQRLSVELLRIRPGQTENTNWATALEIRQTHAMSTSLTQAERRVQNVTR